MKEKILVVGGGAYQVPLIRRIEERGFTACCVDKNENAPGFQAASEYRCIDVLDREACLSYAKELGIAAVMTYGATLTLPTVSYIGEKMHLPALPMDTAEISKSKLAIKQRLSDCGCNSKGSFFKITSPNDASSRTFSFPCVIKPSDGSGSRGVSIVENVKQLDGAITYALQSARYGEAYCEGYVKGQEYSVEAFADGEIIHIYGIVKTTFARHGMHNSEIEYGHRTPSGLNEEQERAISAEVTKAIRALQITMGSVNFDVILSEEDGKPYIIDCGIRIGQNLIASHLIPLSRGVSVIDCSIQLALGRPCDAEPKFRKCVATRLLIPEPGTVREIRPMKDQIGKNGVLDIVLHREIGEIQKIYREKSDHCGWVICEGSCPDEAEQNAERARSVLLDCIITR